MARFCVFFKSADELPMVKFWLGGSGTGSANKKVWYELLTRLWNSVVEDCSPSGRPTSWRILFLQDIFWPVEQIQRVSRTFLSACYKYAEIDSESYKDRISRGIGD